MAVHLSWTASFLPMAGIYNVYHSRKTEAIFQISSRSSSEVLFGGSKNSTKYTYITRPYTSTNISFEIENVTMADAGYYNGGVQRTEAGIGGGVVLIVLGNYII